MPALSESTYERMKRKLSAIVPDAELRYKAVIADEILDWKKRRNAVILAHNYMEPALFHSGIADFCGDSLQLSRDAAATQADVIVFCGVRFMAETAYILNPAKTVLCPARIAGCSLASSITAEDVRQLKARFPGVPVVTYINTYADVKAESDICCTSGNAARVVKSLGAERVIFLPDEYLAANVARETGRAIIFPTKSNAPGKFEGLDYQMVGWTGKCEVHDLFTVDDIRNARKQFPGILILTHPECPPDVVMASDYSASTNAMSTYVRETNAPHYLILTECSMADNIAADNPGKDLVRMCSIRCPHMNEITMEDTLEALKKLQYRAVVPEDIRVRALRSVRRMLEIG
ncbi:MAG: quinolinate synthase NadA [Kiritimatiellia bacterium]